MWSAREWHVFFQGEECEGKELSGTRSFIYLLIFVALVAYNDITDNASSSLWHTVCPIFYTDFSIEIWIGTFSFFWVYGKLKTSSIHFFVEAGIA